MTQGYTKGVPIDTDGTLSLNSNQVVPSQAAVVTYVTSAVAAIPSTFDCDTGSATPLLGTINILGGTGCSTTGASADVTVDLDDNIVGSVATDSGSATPSSNAFTITGTNGITTSATGATVTIDGAAITDFDWNVVTGATQAVAVNNGYFANYAGTLAFTLPSTAAVGDTMQIAQMAASQGWSLAQNAGQTCYIGNTATTTGAGGSLASTADGDWIEIVCRVANTDFQVNVKSGNITVV